MLDRREEGEAGPVDARDIDHESNCLIGNGKIYAFLFYLDQWQIWSFLQEH